MASVALTELFLHDAVDPSDYVSLKHSDMQEETTAHGEKREYAGGRERLITRPGESGSYQVSTCPLGYDVIAELRARKGAVVMLRDTRGRLVYGTYFKLAVADLPAMQKGRASFTVETISFVETV